MVPKIKRKVIESFSQKILIISSLLLIFICSAEKAKATSLSVSPSTGTFEVGSTFDVSLFLNSENKNVNAIRVALEFPPDRLQLVAPTAGQSIVSLWAAYPQYSNAEGTVELQGGVPGGINTGQGLITKLTFRVKSLGPAMIKIMDESKVLANDGGGTDVLDKTSSGVYELVLPAPKGPVVASETHQDQSQWYNNQNVVLNWAGDDEEIEGYSYMLSDGPTDIPDNISEGTRNMVAYENLSDGRQYFHIKSLRDGVWGGITHFAISVDVTSPAKFPIEILPSKKTSARRPIIQFETTDNASGVDHYGIKIVPLSPGVAEATGEENGQFFIEAKSPFIASDLELGSYDVIIRSYDKANNLTEVTETLKITRVFAEVIEGKGIAIKGLFTVSWWLLYGLLILLIAVLVYATWRLKRRFHWLEEKKPSRIKKMHPKIKKKLEELKKLQDKYGKTAIFLLAFSSFMIYGQVSQAEEIDLGPPLVTSVSRNISNEEIFYIGGKTDCAEAEIIIYIQNLKTGETFSQTVKADKKNDWFYRHSGFLSGGEYLLWVQGKVDDQMSPPSPQVKMTVKSIAIQFGSSRLSYETIYLGVIILLLIVVVILTVNMFRHWRKATKRQGRFLKEVREAEVAVHQGFAVLRRDIEAEIAAIGKIKMSKKLLEKEKAREEHLLRDLEEVERHIDKEIWDVEKLGDVK